MREARKYAEFDAGKAEEFAGELLSALNHGALCLMTSIGHRTGLFDAMSTLPPPTADAIAEKAGLNERYVREWLGARKRPGSTCKMPVSGTFKRIGWHTTSRTTGTWWGNEARRRFMA